MSVRKLSKTSRPRVLVAIALMLGAGCTLAQSTLPGRQDTPSLKPDRPGPNDPLLVPTLRNAPAHPTRVEIRNRPSHPVNRRLRLRAPEVATPTPGVPRPPGPPRPFTPPRPYAPAPFPRR